jgi:hypothetical protein
MKMLVLGRQPRRRKDPCKSTYCRRQKIQAGTISQDSPPAIVAYNERCNRVVERSAGPGTPFLFGPSCDLFGQLERKQVSCHPASACLSDRLWGLCWTRAYSDPQLLSSNFLTRGHSTTVFNPSTRVSKCGHSGKEILFRRGSKLRSALGFGPQWRPCNVAHRMLVGMEEGDPDGKAQSEWDRSQL